MQISAIMSRTVITAGERSQLTTICKKMTRNIIGSVIIEKNMEPVGIVTESDIVTAVGKEGARITDLKARDIMRSPIFTKSPEITIDEAAEFMRSNRIRRLPVTQDGRLIGIVTYGDILRYMKKALSDSNTQVRHLRGEVERDGLTEVYNRKYFDRALRREVRRVSEHGGFLSLLMIDLDNFKEINDSYGHAAGDLVLSQVASMILLNVREINIVCRYGGDEFAVIAPISDINGAVRMGERLRQVIEATIVFYKRDELNVTLSVGAATWRGSMENSTGLLAAADKALYQSKQNGRNQVSFE